MDHMLLNEENESRLQHRWLIVMHHLLFSDPPTAQETMNNWKKPPKVIHAKKQLRNQRTSRNATLRATERTLVLV